MARSNKTPAGVTHCDNKASNVENLPSRHAMASQVVKLDQFNRMRGVYAKNAKNPFDDMTPIAIKIDD